MSDEDTGARSGSLELEARSSPQQGEAGRGVPVETELHGTADFRTRLEAIETVHAALIARPNERVEAGGGIFVATTSIVRLLDYATHSPPDPLRSAAAVEQRYDLIRRNLQLRRQR